MYIYSAVTRRKDHRIKSKIEEEIIVCRYSTEVLVDPSSVMIIENVID